MPKKGAGAGGAGGGAQGKRVNVAHAIRDDFVQRLALAREQLIDTGGSSAAAAPPASSSSSAPAGASTSENQVINIDSSDDKNDEGGAQAQHDVDVAQLAQRMPLDLALTAYGLRSFDSEAAIQDWLVSPQQQQTTTARSKGKKAAAQQAGAAYSVTHQALPHPYVCCLNRWTRSGLSLAALAALPPPKQQQQQAEQDAKGKGKNKKQQRRASSIIVVSDTDDDEIKRAKEASLRDAAASRSSASGIVIGSSPIEASAVREIEDSEDGGGDDDDDDAYEDGKGKSPASFKGKGKENVGRVTRTYGGRHTRSGSTPTPTPTPTRARPATSHTASGTGTSTSKSSPSGSSTPAPGAMSMDEQHMDQMVLRVRACTSARCSCAPRCLNWLGQDAWEDQKTSLKQFKKQRGIPGEPLADRDPELPVGLKNLGATCYVNSLLQVWYRDLTFRAGVYACDVSRDKPETSPVFQLQSVFANMQIGQLAVHDPEPLVKVLRLDKGEQQDAQEFAKLFMERLNVEFARQKLRADAPASSMTIDPRRLVEEQFEGKVKHGTRCAGCFTTSERVETYREWEVTLARACQLEKRIRVSLADESLENENRYWCERCGGKRNATRTTQLISVPPVLHLSLLRFTFSMDTLDRVKSQDQITFPLVLDMREFVNDGGSGPLLYDLKGALLHVGASAHHGHYAAQVHDTTSGKWFYFDDEAVSPINDLNDANEPDSDSDVGTSRKRAGAGFTRAENGQIVPRSKDAYMLVYTRREPGGSNSSQDEPIPPQWAKDAVDSLAAAHERDVEAHTAALKAVENDFNELRERKRLVYHSWQPTSGDAYEPGAMLASASGLRRYVEHGFKPLPASAATNGSGASGVAVTNGVANGTSSKPASGEGTPKADDAHKGDDGPQPMAIDENGKVEDKMAIDQQVAAEQPESKAQDEQMANVEATNDSSPSGDEAKPMAVDRDDSVLVNGARKAVVKALDVTVSDDEGHAVAQAEPVKVQVNGDKSEQPHASATPNDAQPCIDNFDVLCAHGKADPRQVEKIKLVPAAGVTQLEAQGVPIEPRLMLPDAVCSSCVAELAVDELYRQRHQELTQALNEALSEQGEDYAFISRDWVNGFKKATATFHVSGTLGDPGPETAPFEAAVVCPHGRLQPDNKRMMCITANAAVWLTSIYPTYKPHKIKDMRPCKTCQTDLEQSSRDDFEDKRRKTDEKKVLPGLQQKKILQVRAPDNWVVPYRWTVEWREWTRNKGPRPAKVDNSAFVCPHGKLKIDIEQALEEPADIALVSGTEWEIIDQRYSTVHPIMVNDLYDVTTTPEGCEVCLADQAGSYTAAAVWVQQLSMSCLNSDGSRKEDSYDQAKGPRASPKLETSPPAQASGSRLGTRRTIKRNRELEASSESTQRPKKFRLQPQDTIGDIKSRIAANLRIPELRQRLWHKRSELSNDQSVEGLGIMAGDTIEVLNVDTDELTLDQDDSGPPRKTRRRGGRAEGFGGTGLLGFDDAPEVDLAEGQIQCPACTLIQDADAKECAVCQEPLS